MWLKENAHLGGVLACGVRYPDKSVFSQVYDQKFHQHKIEEIWSSVAETFQSLKLQRLPTTRLKWTFDEAFLHCVVRNDGVHLCVLTGRKEKKDQVNSETLNQLMSEFLDLQG